MTTREPAPDPEGADYVYTTVADSDRPSGAQAIVDAALASAEPTEVYPGAVVAFVVPAGGSVAVVDRDTDEHRDRPRRQRGTIIVRDERSLIELAKGIGIQPTVYADTVGRSVVAVLNDDEEPGTAGWRDHRVSLTLVHTPEWTRWAANDGKLMSQRDFAEHVEDCLEDIIEPDSATMLEIAQTLEATTGLSFRSQIRLQSGQRQFTYSEETDARAGSGQITVPERFALALTPWAGRDAKPFRVEARLRYRVAASGLTLGYRLVDPDRILRSAFDTDVVKPIRDAGLRVLAGTP